MNRVASITVNRVAVITINRLAIITINRVAIITIIEQLLFITINRIAIITINRIAIIDKDESITTNYYCQQINDYNQSITTIDYYKLFSDLANFCGLIIILQYYNDNDNNNNNDDRRCEGETPKKDAKVVANPETAIVYFNADCGLFINDS